LSCSICGDPASTRCPMCGRLVCGRHFDSGRGLCYVCLEALCEVCGSRLSIARCIYCGRLGCDSCLVQVDNVRRACRSCLEARDVRVGEALMGLERLRGYTLRVFKSLKA